ncbi:Legume-like lectin family protein [Entamoeba marina]
MQIQEDILCFNPPIDPDELTEKYNTFGSISITEKSLRLTGTTPNKTGRISTYEKIAFNSFEIQLQFRMNCRRKCDGALSLYLTTDYIRSGNYYGAHEVFVGIGIVIIVEKHDRLNIGLIKNNGLLNGTQSISNLSHCIINIKRSNIQEMILKVIYNEDNKLLNIEIQNDNNFINCIEMNDILLNSSFITVSGWSGESGTIFEVESLLYKDMKEQINSKDDKLIEENILEKKFKNECNTQETHQEDNCYSDYSIKDLELLQNKENLQNINEKQIYDNDNTVSELLNEEERILKQLKDTRKKLNDLKYNEIDLNN